MTAYNSKYSNRPFVEKRDMEHGFKQSGLRLNQWICQKDKWGEAELEERNNLLLERSLQIWPYIETDYEPPQRQFDTVTLDEDTVFTGKSITKFSLNGVEQVVDSWIDMYQQVLTQLHVEDKSILTKLAVCDDPTVDLSSHFATAAKAFASSREIDRNVFVWTGTDTQYKINVLKKVFVLFDIEPTELVFYLRDDSKSGATDGGRELVRRKYWTYALPILREATDMFNNVNPAKSNWINGYMGISCIHLTCVANFDSARVELYMERSNKEENKKLFDFLYTRKDVIESAVGKTYTWDRKDDTKSSKVYTTLSDVDISNENDWPRMARFHAEEGKAMLDAFSMYLTQYFRENQETP